MIKNFKHKGLKKYYLSGDETGLLRIHIPKIRSILGKLAAAKYPEEMNLPGLDFHSLKGEYTGYYSVAVAKNWKIIFGFDGLNFIDVNYLDYH